VGPPLTRELLSVERLALAVDVKLAWKIRGQLRRQERGVTRNISSRGMFVVTRRPPPRRTLVRFEFSLKPAAGTKPIRVQGEGQVVRVKQTETNAMQTGFALVNQWFKLNDS
jgi:hypothetical protein